MDTNTLIRDASRVHAALVRMEDKSLVAKKTIKIYIPERFVERQLASIGPEIYIVGICAFVVDDRYYGISTTNAMMRIEPTATQTVKMDGDDYLEFLFEPGSRVLATTELLKTDTIVYQIFDEIVSKGRVPWYLGRSYEDLARLFDTADVHAGLKVGGNHAILEMIMTSIARNPENRAQYYRQIVKTREDLIKKPPVYIPFRSVIWSATNTTAKLLGGYSSDGMVSALVNPAQRVERIESLLRR